MPRRVHPALHTLALNTPPSPPLSQRGIKLTTEPPRGLRANILRLYNLLDDTDFKARSAAAPNTYCKLMFSLAWFHAVLIERKKFKALGWSISYDFNNSDYLLAADILSDYLTVPKGTQSDAHKTPWDAIRYLIAEVTYGGRVTDDFDRRIVSTYTSQFFCEDAIAAPFFALSPLSFYYIPEDGPVASYKEYVMSLSSSDPPQAFGQHPNADIQSAITDAEDLLATIVSLQPKSLVEGGVRPEDTVLSVAADLEKQLPELFDIEALRSIVGPRADPEPLKVVLFQEADRYNLLLVAMKRTLRALAKGIAGTVVITPELEGLFDALLVGRVPSAWAFAYPSLKPLGLWIRDLLARLSQLQKWVTRGLPVAFWLGGFTYPTGFLTAILQTTARSDGLAIDTLEFEYPILEFPLELLGQERPKDGAYIHGLFLEGARWDFENACLVEPEPMSLYSPMPVIHFKPVEARRLGGAADAARARAMYKCPMYLYPVRTGTRERPSFMGVVDLKTGSGEPEHWVRRGTALLLALAS